jgi:hypothetical protein
MTEGSKGTPIEVMTERLELLPRRHRIAHLHALVGRQFAGSARRRELAALLRHEMTALAGERGRLQ